MKKGSLDDNELGVGGDDENGTEAQKVRHRRSRASNRRRGNENESRRGRARSDSPPPKRYRDRHGRNRGKAKGCIICRPQGISIRMKNTAHTAQLLRRWRRELRTLEGREGGGRSSAMEILDPPRDEGEAYFDEMFFERESVEEVSDLWFIDEDAKEYLITSAASSPPIAFDVDPSSESTMTATALRRKQPEPQKFDIDATYWPPLPSLSEGCDDSVDWLSAVKSWAGRSVASASSHEDSSFVHIDFDQRDDASYGSTRKGRRPLEIERRSIAIEKTGSWISVDENEGSDVSIQGWCSIAALGTEKHEG